MAELVIVIGKTKKDVIDAIKLKSKVEEHGVRVVKVVAIDTEVDTAGESIPSELIENMLNVKVLTNLKLENFNSD